MDITEALNWQDIGLRLKDLRNKNKITIERLSEIIGVSPSFVGLVERGDSGIGIDNLFKLSRVLNVSVDYILTGESEGSVRDVPAKLNRLNAALADYSDKDIDFVLDLTKFLRDRVDVR